MTPSRFECTPEQRARNAAGLEACRAAIAPALAKLGGRTDDAPLTPSERIRQAALERAISERRDRRLTGPVHFADHYPTNQTSR